MYSQPLKNIIIDCLENSPKKRITFAEYLDLVLYHPEHGYYSSGKVKIGSDGDFFTSPSLGADFGELLAEQFWQMWQILDKPQPFHLLEMGAGSGILAQDILGYLAKNYPDFFFALEYLIVEQSPALIKQQQSCLTDYQSKVFWQTWQTIPPNSLRGCCFSNELIDAFPVHKIIVTNNKLAEIYVTINNQDNFQEITDSLSNPALESYFQLVKVNFPSETYLEGYTTEVNLAALNWLETLTSKLQQGYLLTIDYGYSADRYYHPQRNQGTLQCYYQHRRHNNPYSYLGYQNITTQVDFTALQVQGEKLGLKTLGLTRQGIFLMALGLGDRLNALTTTKLDLATLLKRRDALHQLINPGGLGNFWVLIQEKGLTEKQLENTLRGLKS